ncbi:hypothetical protein PIB30_067738 [Stylosanthes scabra]|uniref:Uncharacterized protein n=1 Tax=Stylosanthes scabra TaxID=79078 RepID=A0ABU6YK91_9FABA|nr:hypothetical protein [Stylosanthes scabra]
MGETYDPICLSDIESDDEWITEKEAPCLPVDSSWIDVHECFTLEEGAPSKKRKRGPRNLNIKINDKGKSIFGDEQEVEEIIVAGEEGEGVVGLNEEDDLSDIDLGE